MKVVFVMDPVSTVIVDEDTTFAMMRAAQAKGHEIYHCLVQDVGLDAGRVMARISHATLNDGADTPIVLAQAQRVDLATVDAVLIRKDPPFDDTYLWLTLILDYVSDQTFVANAPRGLRLANEKLYALHFPELTPRSVIASRGQDIREFVDTVGGKGFIKPIDGHGGEGVFLLASADPNFNALVETVTQKNSRATIVQEFIPEVREGDKRILLLDGEPLGAILRVPQPDDVRSNIHVGGSVKQVELDEKDRHIIETVKPRLKKDGLHFVGLDVIGGLLTEINVTSPTGIQQMSRFAGRDLAEDVIDWLESRVRSHHA